MTYPRAHLIDPDGGIYHVCSRCVRRAWLCGTDKETGFNFDHRRQWLEDRILTLSDIFAVELFGYAVMSNHYHLVLQIDAGVVQSWSDEVVVDKWLLLCPKQFVGGVSLTQQTVHRNSLLQNKERLLVFRERLSSLSWFMRMINEPLARTANQEDRCKGRCWEGRFKSQRLLDEDALLACMVYVDLNPVRAGMVEDVIDAEHTSVARRLKANPSEKQLMTAIQSTTVLPFDYRIHDYIALARTTASAQRANRFSGRLRVVDAPDTRLSWLEAIMPVPGRWQRAIGTVQNMKDYAKGIGQCWVKTYSRC